MISRLCLAAFLLIGRLAVAQSPTVVVRDAGPGPVGRLLDVLLKKPDTRVVAGDTVSITKDSVYPGSVVVLAKRAYVSGEVKGDVVVVGGDLILRPGGRIEGEGIAIGGAAYNSLLGSARGGLTSYRDFTYDVERTPAGIDLRYRETYVGATPTPVLTLPVFFGFRLPGYDRSNGVSLPVGPAIAVGRGTVDLLATYRSQIGRVDPSAEGRLDVGRKLWIDAWAGRETRSNDAWITGAISNSLKVLISGRDERNWYRATGGRATINKLFETPTLTSTYSLGGTTEDAASARPGLSPTSGPWAFMDKTNAVKGMYRPNPQIPGGEITSVIAGAAYRWTGGKVKARLDVDLEVPVSVSTNESFQQATIDGRIDFPTFGLQRYRLEAHGVITTGDTAPMQRYAYLGGSGTLPTEDPLVFGGDQLLFLESRYEIPVPRIKLPLIGSPTFMFRHILGAAGVQTLPDITQIVGVRLSVPFVRLELLMDTKTRETKFSAGLSLSR